MVRIKRPNSWDTIVYLYRINPMVMVKRLMKKVFSYLYRYDKGYILSMDMSHFSPVRSTYPKEFSCAILKTPESLSPEQYYMPSSFPYMDLKQHLANDPLSVLVIAFRQDSEEVKKDIVGYFQCQPGFFRVLGIEGPLPSNILYTIRTEVMPAYRGQRIAQMMRDVVDEYCLEKGFVKRISTILAHNQPSIKSALREGRIRIIGGFEYRSFIGGRYIIATTMEQIRQMIEKSEILEIA